MKRGKAVTGSTFYSVGEDGDSIDDSVLGYKTLADARHAVELYMDREKQFDEYMARRNR